MTPTKKATVRLSSARFDRREVVVILGPGDLIGFRSKGRRKVYETTVAACMSMAVKATVQAQRAAKRAARKAR
jgi:hypothetical protein